MLDRDFQLKPSIYYIGAMWVLLLTSVTIVFLLPIWPGFRFCGALMIASYVGYILWRYGFLQSKASIVRIKPDLQGAWQISTLTSAYTARLCGSSTITAWISVLRFQLPNQSKVTCVVCRDSLSGDRYRQLIVTLRLS